MEVIEVDTCVQQKGLKFVHINARSSFNKLQEIYTHYKHCDIIVITETWLHRAIPDAAVVFPEFRLIRLDRHTVDVRKGGGICMYVRETCNIEHLEHLCDVTNDYELLCVKVKFPNIKPCYVLGTYTPPKGKPIELFDRLTTILGDLDLSRSELYILGDLNIDYQAKAILKRLHIDNFESHFNIRQIINVVTRMTATTHSTLDWIYTNSEHVAKSGTLNHNISDHLPVYVVRKKIRNKSLKRR